MSRALYRKYRSKSLDEIVGQDHITHVLKNAIEKKSVSHAYLLTGPRGVGKTSIARILAHEINGLPYNDEVNHLDIIEIDAASNNGVDDVRDLREKVQIAPVSADKKIYIIDEVHMLSKAAFNALLKTLEEPPAHIVFILATTDVEKLPPTIISRTQHFGFRSISTSNLEKHLTEIAKKEKITIEPEAIALIAHRGDGSFRDSITLLDQLSSLSDEKTGISRELVEKTLGLATHELVVSVVEAYEKKDLARIIELLDQSDQQGTAGETLAGQLISYVRDNVVAKPQLLILLDELLSVSLSTRPSIKLLTVLARHAQPVASKPKTAALVAEPIIAPLVLEKPIPELEKKASEPLAQPTAPASVTKKLQSTDTKTPEFKNDTTQTLTSFDWHEYVAEAKKTYVATYSVLSKCSYEIINGELTLYTGNAFYKKKLDDNRYRSHLFELLRSLGYPEVVINTIPTPSPLKDEQAAKVAAIMGGGEAVEIQENGD